MWIECLIRRKGGSTSRMPGGTTYHFFRRADSDPRHVDWVEKETDRERFLSIPEGYRVAEDYGEVEGDEDNIGNLTNPGSASVEPEPDTEPEVGTRAWLEKATKAEMIAALEEEGLDLPNSRWSKADIKDYVEAILQIGTD